MYSTSIEVIYISRTSDFIPVVMVSTSGKLFIVPEEHIIEDNRKFYVLECYLTIKYQPA